MPNHSVTQEPFLTIKQVASELNLHYWQLQRAVKAGVVPSYTPFNKRRLLRMSEVIAVIEATCSVDAR